MKLSSKIKLDPYTKASNCTDMADVEAGIAYIKQAIKLYEDAGKKVPGYLYIRWGKLIEKAKKYEA